jgi:pimeloyl-ACP methyl ester carboxylesterase
MKDLPVLYCISGLGADERVFQYLNLPTFKLVFVKWETPLPQETLEDYCNRLLPQINQQEEIRLMGVSFGGIIAQEISRLIPVKKIILVSSIKSPLEMDWKMRWISASRLYTLFPARILKWMNLLTADYYFSVESKEESNLLRQIILDTDLKFSQWAISKIMRWKHQETTTERIHIHGNRDRIFPTGTIRNFTEVKNAGHFMIVNRAETISRLIQEELN